MQIVAGGRAVLRRISNQPSRKLPNHLLLVFVVIYTMVKINRRLPVLSKTPASLGTGGNSSPRLLDYLSALRTYIICRSGSGAKGCYGRNAKCFPAFLFGMLWCWWSGFCRYFAAV